jgi:predicted dehydrogenase
MIKVGMIGMGGMGWFHVSKLCQMPNVQIVALADITPERLEATHAVQINIAGDSKPVDLSAVARYTDGSRLIAEADVDVVDICLPTYLHSLYAIEALQHGKHVLCEKPMSLTLGEAQAMIDVSRQSNRLLMIAQCIRFWPEYRFLRDCVRDGRYGKLLSLNMSRTGGRPAWSWTNWFLDPTRSGGPLQDLHIHDVDFVNYLLGKPDQLYCSARKTAVTGTYDVAHTVFSYTDGPQVHIHAGWSYTQVPFVAIYDAWFEYGFIRYDGRFTPAVLVYENPLKVESKPAEFDATTDAYYNEIAYFLDCVAHDMNPGECPPESARDSLSLIRDAITSAESGQAINPR